MKKLRSHLGLYDPNLEHSACGVGFLTRKDGNQTHEILKLGNEALCAVPHRGGMSAEGVGDGAGVSIDLSESFFSKLTKSRLKTGKFGVGNFFFPNDKKQHNRADEIIKQTFNKFDFKVLLQRTVPVNMEKLDKRAQKYQLPIKQWIFLQPDRKHETYDFDSEIYKSMLMIEARAYQDLSLEGFYPLSLSSKLQVLKGRLNSWELIPYFNDLNDPEHEVHSLYFHTRFSTNTDPHPTMAQPFRLMAHNGELNTDKKNRLSETAIARARNNQIIRPKGQSDSCRLDQTLNSRVFEENLDLVTAVVSMMPPAWENDKNISKPVKAMLEYFSLFEEKNDGPAALIFGDGKIIGARLDRLGLRPLRSVETAEFLAVTSEAGQIYFDPEKIISRGRVEAGGMIYYDHDLKKTFRTNETLENLASRVDYQKLLSNLSVKIKSLPEPKVKPEVAASSYDGDLELNARYVAYSHNQESFKFLLDPMLNYGSEKVSAMGYGNAINALSDVEGGIAKYFSQRFAQVTNPPLDSIREADGMTLRVSLGEKPHNGKSRSKQIILDSPILKMSEILKIREQKFTPCETFDILYEPEPDNVEINENNLLRAIDNVCDNVANFAQKKGGIAILSDRGMSKKFASIPLILVISAINQKLIADGLRLKVSVIAESGQIVSSHHIACALGFGASAVYPISVRLRSEELFGDEKATEAFQRFRKAGEKALMKTMGKVGLCTAESYIGGEFFEPNFLDTNDPILSRMLPNMKTPVGGVRFRTISQSAADWHSYSKKIQTSNDIPILGLFKERSEGAGHSFGTAAVRGFVDLTEEEIKFSDKQNNILDGEVNPFSFMTLNQMKDAFDIDENGYVNTSFEELDESVIDNFEITSAYRKFSLDIFEERMNRPAALRDILSLPADITYMTTYEDIKREMMLFNRAGNNDFVIRGLTCVRVSEDNFNLNLTGPLAYDLGRLDILAQTLIDRFNEDIKGHFVSSRSLNITATGFAKDYLERLRGAPSSIAIDMVQPASEITKKIASGAMSHGALVASAHEAVAHGTNMVGGMSNSGEGGEHISRYGTIRASRIKQFASGRFGVWAGYLADPKLEEIEIKIGQGAKPGEGGQLPAAKVTVEIAAARGGTPGVELISPPPHHDTYSIEDLAQLIHDAKAARVRVIVKLVSSEGIGTIAVGVAKAGADVINVAGNTGGTGAAAVTSLKYTGRAAEIGIAEVHQALSHNGLREKVVLRSSGAMQTGLDIIKASLLGADSFEFGTTALMMLKCVMAKNCNIKCPAGLTTNAETFSGDPRALAQYLLNIAHDVREILAMLGFKNLEEARGRSDLLHLLDHPASIGHLNLRGMLTRVEAEKVNKPKYMPRDYSVDDFLLGQVENFLRSDETEIILKPNTPLNNRNKSVGGQLSIDIERILNYGKKMKSGSIVTDNRGRRFLDYESIKIATQGSAGQSFGAFCNDGMVFEHTGTCNDGVGKGACGGKIIVKSPAGGGKHYGDNVLVGNFTLFGASGGKTFIEGQAGDRFAVRNSGATAVVEGVGEFCAEYMTNGAILNIGGFSNGFGNGMSGGFAYQYDPENIFEQFVSHDSVILGKIGQGETSEAVHEHAVKQMLEWHYLETKSLKAKKLIQDWEKIKEKIWWVMPKALLQYQDYEEILSSKSRKEITEELAIALANHQVKKIKSAWKLNSPVNDGAIPTETKESKKSMAELLNSYTVLDMAQKIILKKSKNIWNGNISDQLTKNLIMTEDFSLMTELSKYAKEALADYTDEEIAILVANKRLTDFKQALALRNVISMESPATYSWIIYQNQKNINALGSIPSFDELFAKSTLAELSQTVFMDKSNEISKYTH